VPAHAWDTNRAAFVTCSEMKVAVIGRGNVGGGLADLWTKAGHDVTRIGHEGGDVSGSEAILLACPSGSIEDALDGVEGIGRTPVIDATNVFGSGRPEGFSSLTEFVKSQTGGPVAKAFNANFAALYARLGEARVPPSMVFAAEDEARAVTEQLIRDAGYEPVYAGGLESARVVEDFLGVIFAIAQSGTGRFWYRIAPPESF
jgi:predicted dinucleotide-binding enzyme